MRHRLSARAESDVKRLYRQSILQFGRERADRYLSGLDAAFSAICLNPSSAPARPDLRGLRLRRYESHPILYRVDPTEILIVRVCMGGKTGRGTCS